MKHRNKWLFPPCLFMVLLTACQKDVNPDHSSNETIRLPQTQQEKDLVASIRKVESVLRKIYTDPTVTAEVNAAIKCGYYREEAVKLYDLLHPETSLLYQFDKFKRMNVQAGVFKRKFGAEMGWVVNSDPLGRNTGDYFDDHGITIYFPYSEEFTNPRSSDITLVAADRDANQGPGNKPDGTNPDGSTRYAAVEVNDDYAYVYPTHIVGVIDRFLDIGGIDSLPPPAGSVDRVFHGHSRLASNYDALISFTGNGGGSEIKIARVSGYLQVQNQQVTNFAGDVVTVDYSRRDVKKKRWKRVYSVWDADWVPANNEQIYAIWEDDTEGTKTFTGSVSTTLLLSAFDSTQTIQASIGFNISVKTKDDIITQRKLSRYSYFRTATEDQGGGFNMCSNPCGGGSVSPCQDNTFLVSGYWPIWDCGTEWKYTWPYRIY